MLKEEVRRAVSMTFVWMLIFSLGCGTGSKTNSNQNTPTPIPTACLIKDPAYRASQVQDELAAKLGIGNAGNTMKIEVQIAPSKDYLLLLVEGSSKGKVKFGEQMQVVKEYMVDACIISVYFVPDGTVAKTSEYSGEGFEWSTCEWPKQPCPDGTCNC